MTQGRKPRATPIVEVIDPTLDQDKINGAMTQMRADGKEDLVDLCELAGDVGALRALELTSKFVAAATVQLFQKVRESKQINKLPLRMPDGTVAMATGIDDFCRLAFGKPRTTMIEAAETLEALGESAYETASRLGLNRSALRATRSLPPEKLEAVRLAIANGSTKADVMTLIEDLALKAEEAQAEVTEAQAELVAKDQLLADKNKRIDQLKAAQKRIAKAPTDEQLAELQKEATAIMHDAQGALRGGVRHALIALQNHDEDNGTFMAGLVGQLQADLNALRDEFSLPDISNAEALQVAADMAQWDKS